MVLMIICPCSLVSIYFSLTSASGSLRQADNDRASTGVTFIIKDLQQLPHCLQSIFGVISSFISCTSTSIAVASCRFKNKRSASFSPSFSAAITAIVARCVINCGSWVFFSENNRLFQSAKILMERHNILFFQPKTFAVYCQQYCSDKRITCY